MTSPKLTHREAGFTLIELSIVLVIIGLIAGGILVGQDMIKAASIRNVTKQVENYNSAINAFRDKYGALPGDSTPTRVTQFNLPDAATPVRTGTAAGLGNGDGLLTSCAVASPIAFGCETAWIWNDLAFAQLIPDPLNVNTPTGANISLAAANAASYVPRTKLRDAALISVYSYNGRNFFLLGNQSSSATAYTTTAGLTVREANDIDTKVDDGAPTTGTVTSQISGAVTGVAFAGAAVGSAVCNTNATPSVYNTGSSGAYLENVNCLLGIRMQ